MAYAPRKMVADAPELPRLQRPLRNFLSRFADARSELESLRAVNARLLRELAELKEREAQALNLAHRRFRVPVWRR
jgi:hypothetical protein